MSKDTYYKQRFQCPECEKIVSEFTWASKVHENKCGCTETSLLEPLFEEELNLPHIGGKFAKGRSMKERNARRSADFKENILPGLGGWEKKHFEKKLGKLGQKYK